MGICKVGMTVGSAVGWTGAIAVALWGGLGEDTVPTMMVLLSVALFTSGALAMRCYQRPLGDAYELGYERGRRDAIRVASRRTGRQILDLTPIRSVNRGSREYQDA